MKLVKQKMYDLISKCSSLSVPVVRFLTLRLGLFDSASHEFGWFLKRSGLKIPVAAKLGNGMPISVYLGERVSESIRRSGYYEPETVALLGRLLEPGMHFLDVGAHVGQYTLFASPLVGQQGGVHCFEAEIDNYDCLKRNIDSNELKNVTATNVAVADEQGELTLYLGDSSNLGTNSLSPPHNSTGRSYVVPSITLDLWCEQHELNRVDVVKVDIEGAEFKMLKGANNLLSRETAPVFLMELNQSQLAAQGASAEALLSLMRIHGYEFYSVDDLISFEPNTNDPDFLNVIAVPKKGREELLARLRGPSAT